MRQGMACLVLYFYGLANVVSCLVFLRSRECLSCDFLPCDCPVFRWSCLVIALYQMSCSYDWLVLSCRVCLFVVSWVQSYLILSCLVWSGLVWSGLALLC